MELRKDSIDLGIVCVDAPAMLAFYRDVLGLEHSGDNPVPGGGTMHRLMAGTSMLKLLAVEPAPAAANPGGGMRAATGMRYFTFTVADLAADIATCEAAGHPPVQRISMGPVEIALFEDPDGNAVELVQLV